jgi:hypothetical protein
MIAAGETPDTFAADWQPAPDDQPEAQPAPVAVALGDLKPAADDDGQTLLGHRYLCRGKSLLFVGPTGIGKSVAAMQAKILWSLGKPAFGIRSAGKLKSLIVQAENDDGDMVEMRDGIYRGLGLTPEEMAEANRAVLVVYDDESKGATFIARLAALLELHKPDLVWIDPLFAYVGGEVASQEVMSNFCRTWINPLIRKHGCGAVILHHVNKPAGGRDKPDWKAGDMAYLGSGSAELANWARAVLAIRNIGSHDVFELVAGKRGKRLGWCDDDGQPSFSRHIGHGRGMGAIYWREASPDEVPQPAQTTKRKPATLEDVLAHVPARPQRIEKGLLIDRARAAKISMANVRQFISEAVAKGTLTETQEPRPGSRPAIYIARA